MKNNNSSERHIINNLKVIIDFERFFQSSIRKYLRGIKRGDVTSFLDNKMKPSEMDTEKKWIAVWNHYFNHIKFFFRWLCNEHYNNPGKVIPWRLYDD